MAKRESLHRLWLAAFVALQAVALWQGYGAWLFRMVGAHGE